MKGAPTPPAPYRLKPAFPAARFNKPTSLVEIPGRQQLLVTEQNGKVFALDKKTAKVRLVADLGAKVRQAGGVSLFGGALHPKFSKNRLAYFCLVHPAGKRHTRVVRYEFNADGSGLKPDSEKVIITWPAGGHNGGCLKFGKDGYLYISTGDGSGPNPPDGLTTGQDVSDLLGAVLRIDVDRQDNQRAYRIPSDNPFVGMKNARAEIWAYGLRNPWKFGIDSVSGEVFVADNGWESWELVHRIVRGGNCGWPVMEGRAVLRSEVKVGPTPIIPPLKDHPHTEANSVIGGPVYRGPKLPKLNGYFIYGDYITGTIWALRSEGGVAVDHQTLVDTDQRIVAFAEGSGGELYVLDYDFTGQIYEIVPSGRVDNSGSFPRRLSQTGLFQSLEELRVSPGVIPYSVRAPRWQDGATARRWIAIPGSGQVNLNSDLKSRPVFPDGTVLVKHLDLVSPGQKTHRVETQLLHLEDDEWRPYSYLWDKAGKEAYLIDSIGSDRTLSIADGKGKVSERNWHVGAQNECRLCHNAGSNFVLGFVPNQLSFGASGSDQLRRLAEQRVISKIAHIESDDPSHLVNPHDKKNSLDDRARSYLHVNCSSCHHKRGNAIVSFFLRREMPFEQLKTNKGTGIGTFGMRNAKLIVPGDPYRSVLFYRMSKLGYSRMPYIGSQVVDSRGIALIEAWIRSLESDTDSQKSAPLKSGSAEFEALRLLVTRRGNQADRRAAMGRLMRSTEGALALAARLHAGSLSAADHRIAVTLAEKLKSTDRQGVLENFIPEARRRKRLGPTVDPAPILALTGDVARGRLIFFSDGARCRNCHDASDPKKSLGPSLRQINKKYPQLAEMVKHALQPSLKVDDAFAARIVATNKGRVVTGLLQARTKDQVILKTAEGKTIKLLAAEIEQMRKSPKSLMPDFIFSDLTAQEAADLVAYIRSLGSG